MTMHARTDEGARNRAWLADAWERAAPTDDDNTRIVWDLMDLREGDRILAEHPDREEKIGVGRGTHFRVFRMRGVPGFHLALDRVDGTVARLRVSRPWAGLSPRQRLMRVLRAEVRPQITRERHDRLDAGVDTCEDCGAKLDSTAQMDHFPIPFVMLADAWLATQDDVPLTRRDVDAADASTRSQGSELANRWQARSWQVFHWEHARLRLVCAACNATEGDHGATAARAKEQAS